MFSWYEQAEHPENFIAKELATCTLDYLEIALDHARKLSLNKIDEIQVFYRPIMLICETILTVYCTMSSTVAYKT